MWIEVAESCCNSMKVDDTYCLFESIISHDCLALNAPVAFTLTPCIPYSYEDFGISLSAGAKFDS